MSDQHKEQAPKKRALKGREIPAAPVTVETPPAPIDTAAPAVPPAEPEPAALAPEPETARASDATPVLTPAAAALARAVEGARQPVEPARTETPRDSAPEPVAIKAPRPRVEAPPTAVAPASPSRRYAVQAAAVILALGAGWAAGSHFSATPASATVAVPAWAEAATAGIRDNRDDVVRLAGDVRALKVTLEALKEGLDKPRPDAGARQVLERLERSERVAQEASARLVKVAEHLDRIEREPAKAAGAMTERLERIERQVIATANTVAGGAPVAAAANPVVPDPTQTASLPKFDPRQTQVEGWVLLEVYKDGALVEGRNKAHEIAPGQALPGLGKVQAIEKRGKAWIVVTDKGFIGAEAR